MSFCQKFSVKYTTFNVNMFQYNLIRTERMRTGGGVSQEDIFPFLSHSEQLALQYAGEENVRGNNVYALIKNHKRYFRKA